MKNLTAKKTSRTVATIAVGGNVKPMIDELGGLQAQAAEIAKKVEGIKRELYSLGPGAYEGAMFRVVVSKSDRERLDMVAVREKLSPQFLRANTIKTPVLCITVKARTGENVKEIEEA